MQASNAPSGRIALALDIGGTHASAAAVDLACRRIVDGTLRRRRVCEDASEAEILSDWVEAAREAIPAGLHAGELTLGIAIPGPFEYEKGVSRLEHKFRALYGKDVGALLRQRLPGAKIVFDNDAALFSLGEQWGGEATGLSRVLGITLGTGLGAGFVVDGRIVRGDDPVTDETLWQQPYGVGTTEDYSSGRGLERIYMDIADRHLEAREIARLAEQGFEPAVLAWHEFGHHLGQILLPSIRRLSPDAVVLGGSVSRSAHLFMPTMDLPVKILPSRLFDSSALLGAAFHASHVHL